MRFNGHVATPSGLAVALGRTTATVTAFLEQLVGEPIDAYEPHHEMTHSDNTNRLGVGSGRQLLKRTVVLRGGDRQRRTFYAESLLVPGRLPAEFSRQLGTVSTQSGELLTEEGIAFTRASSAPRST